MTSMSSSRSGLTENIFCCDYFSHNASYWEHRSDPNVSYLVYEEMKRNPRDAVLTIGRFLGHNYEKKLLDNNESIVNQVIKYSTIDYMKTDVSEDYESIFRKGVVGDWRCHLTRDQSDRVDRKFEQYFGGTELQDIWGKDMEW